MRAILIALLAVVAQACTPVDMMPRSASQIDFSGQTGEVDLAKYRKVETFSGWSRDQIFAAAKVGLGGSGFRLKKVSPSEGYVIGEHGAVLRDWNVVAGVYFMEFEQGIKVVVMAEGSKDIGFNGESAVGIWPDKILERMQRYLDNLYAPASEVAVD